MLKVKGVLPLHRSCFPVISVDKQTPSYIPTKADRVSTSWNSLSSITKQLDSSNDSTPLSAPLRLKHAPNASVSPPPRLLYVLCARIS